MPSHASLHVQVWYINAQIWAGTPRCANLGTTWCSCMFHKTFCQGLRYGSAPLGNSVQSGGYHTSEMAAVPEGAPYLFSGGCLELLLAIPASCQVQPS